MWGWNGVGTDSRVRQCHLLSSFLLFFCSLIVLLSTNLLRPMHLPLSTVSATLASLLLLKPGVQAEALGPSPLLSPPPGMLFAYTSMLSTSFRWFAKVTFSRRPSLITSLTMTSLSLTTLPIPSPALPPDTFHAFLILH